MNQKGKDIKFKFNVGTNSLYELGYISVDLYQIIVFCELLESNDTELLDTYFYSKKFPININRYSAILEKYREKTTINNINKGTIEITISGISLLATIIIPFIVLGVTATLKKYNAKVYFEVNVDDKEVNRLIDYFEKGYYYSGEKGVKVLFRELKKFGYSVEILGKDIYKISKVIESYEKRMVRIVKKH